MLSTVDDVEQRWVVVVDETALMSSQRAVAVMLCETRRLDSKHLVWQTDAAQALRKHGSRLDQSRYEYRRSKKSINNEREGRCR